MTNLARLARLVFSVTITVFAVHAAVSQAPANRWQQPAAELAGQIAGILGPGQARLTVRNLSTIPANELPAIQMFLQQDLKAHGVQSSDTDSASTIRITLSENLRERLWVAEVVQGNETRVAMIAVGPAEGQSTAAGEGVTLRRQTVLVSKRPVLAMVETASGLLVLEPEATVLYVNGGGGWQEARRLAIAQRRSQARDPRGVIAMHALDDGFDAYIAGMECSGRLAPDFSTDCRAGDDPWPVLQLPISGGGGDRPAFIGAFYNAGRDYFTGVLSPGTGVDLPPFYSAALIAHGQNGAELLIGGIGGKVQLAETGQLKAVSGTRDWGSDFAVLHSSCGTSDQVIASGSGEAASDSLRAYELPALEAVPVSAPLAMDGSVTAVWSAPDGKSVMAVVRHTNGDYEVDRVAALCNQ